MELPKINELDWHGGDWENGGYCIKDGYILKRIGIKHWSEANFVCQYDMDRVIQLWNATRHLSQKSLDELCKALLTQRDDFSKTRSC